MRIIGIDPGQYESAYVLVPEIGPLECLYTDNEKIVRRVYGLWSRAHHLAIEGIEYRESPTGSSTFETCYWIGEFRAIWRIYCQVDLERFRIIKPRTIRQVLGGNKIKHILWERYGPGRDKAVGTKKNPGPLYELANYGRINGTKKATDHLYNALAVAVTYWELLKQKGEENVRH